MALTLVQAAKLSNTALQRGVIQTFVNNSVVLDRLPLMNISGNAYAYNVEATLPTVAFRSVNEAYTENTGTFNQLTESLVILGGDADVDRFLVQTRGNLNDLRQIVTEQKVRSATMTFQDYFINGDVTVDTKGFDGLKKRLAGSQVITAGTNGIPVVGNGGTDTQTFFDQLDALMAAVPGGPDVLYTNASIRAKIRSAGRRIGGVDIFNEDATGKRVIAWNGVPIMDIGTRSDGTAVIPQTETQGTASGTTSSIYAVKFGQGEGDQAVTGLTNGGIMVDDLGQLQSQPVYRTRIEFYCGIGVFGAGGARLKGILNA
jgi:hypothetical protein